MSSSRGLRVHDFGGWGSSQLVEGLGLRTMEVRV